MAVTHTTAQTARAVAPANGRAAAGAAAGTLGRLFAPLDAASLLAFRVLFGVLAAASAVRFVALGWVNALYMQPSFHFSYPGFAWVKPLPGAWMYAPFAVMIASGAAIALGWRYRWAVTAYGVSFLYVELIDPSYYLNHYYFMSLITFGLLWMPLSRGWSLDALFASQQAATKRAATPQTSPRAPSAPLSLPAWMLWALRAQVGLVYFFAGVAKLNPDWLLRAEPLRTWLSVAAMSWPSPLSGWLASEATAYGMSYAGAVFDLTIPFWLLWRRSRPWAYAAVVIFHAATGALFQIGVFPWVMALSALVFFPPDWPRRALSALRRWQPSPLRDPTASPPPLALPFTAAPSSARQRRWAMAGLTTYFALQAALPLRHHLYPGDPLWTEEGFNYAWHVMVMEKGGHADFWVHDPHTGQRWLIDPASVLDPIQAKVASTNPELMRQVAHLLAARFRAQGHPDVEVFAIARVSLNGHPARDIVDPRVDLAAQPWRWGAAPWISR